MDENKNASHRIITAEYQLYDVTNAEMPELIEQTKERPFEFVTGMGTVLPAFETALQDLNEGDEFDFTLSPEEGYGDYVAERVVSVDKDIFTVDGRFDDEHIRVDAIVPLQNQAGQQFNGRVVEITDDKVKFDLNHPLAGKRLRFHGRVHTALAMAPEMAEEYERMISGGCGGSCGSCKHHCGGCH